MSDFPWLTGAVSGSTADVVADVKTEAVWLVLHMQANGTREEIASALRTLRLVWGDPPPASAGISKVGTAWSDTRHGGLSNWEDGVTRD